MKNYLYIININKKTATLKVTLFFCLIFALFISLKNEVAAASELEGTTFLIDSSYDYNNRSEIQASLKKTNTNAYFYVENDYYNNLSNNQKEDFNLSLNSLASDFDNIIYPRMRNIFGTEWNPGIDSDSKITILFTKTSENVGGYFNPNDEYRKERIVDGKSNEKEMIYLNIAFIDNKRIKSFLAHEFQHMITWYKKNKLRNISDNVWLNEARSEYASTAIGYDNDSTDNDSYNISNLKARINSFKSNPVDSITEWQNKIDDYSSVNLLSQYLAGQFGENIFNLMLSNDKVGIESINEALLALNREETFRSVFENWSIANYLNDTTIESNGKYGYTNTNINYDNFHISPQNQYLISNDNVINISNSIKDWTSEYYVFNLTAEEYDSKDKIKISFTGDNSGQFSVSSVIFYQNGEIEVKNLETSTNQSITNYIPLSKNNISSFALIPTSYKNDTNFGSNINKYTYSLSLEIINNSIFGDDSLLKSNNDSKIYLIEKNKKRWINSVQSFVSNGYDWKNVVVVTDNEISQFQDGEEVTIFPVNENSRLNGSLFRSLTDSKVYLIKDNYRIWITSAQTFVSLGYKWKDVVIVTDRELNRYMNGESI